MKPWCTRILCLWRMKSVLFCKAYSFLRSSGVIRKFMIVVGQGIISGLIVSIMLSYYDKFKDQEIRASQIQSMRNRVEGCHAMINVDPHFIKDMGECPNSARFDIFEHCIEGLRDSLNYRADKLATNEQYDLRRVLTESERLIEKHNRNGSTPDSMNAYLPTFVGLAALTWFGFSSSDMNLQWIE